MFKRLLALLLLLPGSAMAVDGVREINQACALAGCFPGDSPGFPVTINLSGSFRLTSDLDVRGLSTPQNRTAIDIGNVGGSPALDVTIDMNGFAILGPVSCTGNPVTSCSPAGGTGDGINTNSNSNAHVRIHNGMIRGMGRSAISCANNCRVSDVSAEQNGGTGFADPNGDSLYMRCVARRNGSNGFFVKGIVRDSIAVGNANYGLFTNPDSQIISSQVIDNGGNGVRCFSCSLLDSLVNDNVGFGVEFGGRPIYGRNLIDGNTAGEISGAALQVDINRCGNAAC
ncbi:right-handed parallel beta-helix repeat-containing protein [Halomonas denitrificans]|nr:right-handed parallel beta-helix repeat-containing protein [Halomonas denitrificans]